MGYGGALLWTALAYNLRRKHPLKRIAFVYHRTEEEYRAGVIHPDHFLYENNPQIDAVIPLFWYKKYRWLFPSWGWVIVDMERSEYKYWETFSDERQVFKKGAHAIEIMCRVHGIEKPKLSPVLRLRRDEVQQADRVLCENGLKPGQYLCLEPGKPPASGMNKEWFWERWQEFADRLSEEFKKQGKDWKIVQTGREKEPALRGVVVLGGSVDFRGAGRILEQSRGLICYEGGLVHLAQAMRVKAVVLMSGFMVSGLMDYPDHEVLYRTMECSGCGFLIPCPIDRECMKRITVEDVFQACLRLIDKAR